jgi:hypothetical protein
MRSREKRGDEEELHRHRRLGTSKAWSPRLPNLRKNASKSEVKLWPLRIKVMCGAKALTGGGSVGGREWRRRLNRRRHDEEVMALQLS